MLNRWMNQTGGIKQDRRGRIGICAALAGLWKIVGSPFPGLRCAPARAVTLRAFGPATMIQAEKFLKSGHFPTSPCQEFCTLTRTPKLFKSERKSVSAELLT